MAFLGVDIGSVSVKTAWLAEDGQLLAHTYRRHFGRPLETARALLDEELAAHPGPLAVAFTGTGGKKVAELLQAPFENEMICQARAGALLTPEARSLIVVGGEDSFLVILDDGGSAETIRIRDFAMNGLCAAGAGSFLDQQASRLGVEIEGEFGQLALTSERPARVAGRCSVFAKTDMIHLQQKATPVCDIVAGLCFAFARNFVAVLAQGKDMRAPVAFHGGVALNAGMVRAFRELLGYTPDEFLVPEHAATAGAVGAAVLARKEGRVAGGLDLTPVDAYLAATPPLGAAHPPLPDPGAPPATDVDPLVGDGPVDAFLGVDIGSVSTNVVLMDADKRVLAKRYLMTAGRPIEAVRQGIAEVAAEFADRVVIRGVCTTGSGRYLIGDYLGADVVKNEITAQARAAAEIDPLVDTIFEIGGQDSKYISLQGGAIVDFEMNKVCAAGTGSFLEEQSERLGVSIKGEFSALALAATAPVRLGERCTVFMESDLVGQQSRGATTPDLTAGLAYSIVNNYLNRVVGDRKVGDRIFFQGGTAFNRAVVAAFAQVTGKPITVPRHHEVTGAIGCALIAREHAQAGVPSRFKGWAVSTRPYTQDSFTCKACANQCEINRVKIEGEETMYLGGRCEKYEKRRAIDPRIPDLFTEREAALLAGYTPGERRAGTQLVGIPRALHFLEYAPFWLAFFEALRIPVRLSAPTNKELIHGGLETVQAEFCFPVKVAHGHAQSLIAEGVTHLFFPNVEGLPKLHPGYLESVPCPYVQSIPYILRAALHPEEHGVEMLAPVIDLGDDSKKAAQRLHAQLDTLGVSRRDVERALDAARAAQAAFGQAMHTRGQEVFGGLGATEHAVVIVSRPYNGCDNGLNLEIPTRFRELGIMPIPMDMIPVEDVDLSGEFPDLTWRYGQKILSAGDLISRDARLHAVYITNFGCGPDSFLLKFFRARMGGKCFLQLEIDEHSSDVGALTRCEAFLDSMDKGRAVGDATVRFRKNELTAGETRTMLIPNMCDAAYAVAAAFRSVGVNATVLPETDAESLALAKRQCTGKECFPCIVTTGDMLRHLKGEGVDPSSIGFFMPSAGGGCRIGYYNLMQRLILDELGYDDVPIFVPNQSRGFYDALGTQGGNLFVRRGWQGILAIEMLEKALHFARPAEMLPGSAARVYDKYLHEVENLIEAGADLQPAMIAARKEFEAIPLYEGERPWIGLVGEAYVRMNRFSNQQVIRRIEEKGGRAWLAPMSEWLYYVNKNQKEDALRDGNLLEFSKLKLMDVVMKQDEHHLASPWEGFIPNLHEVSPEETEEEGKRYVDPSFRGEVVLSLGKARIFHRTGVAGVINLMPFTCMPGNISAAIFKRFQQEHTNMPVLNLSFDGQETGDLTIRMEAFLQQCLGYLERWKAGV